MSYLIILNILCSIVNETSKVWWKWPSLSVGSGNFVIDSDQFVFTLEWGSQDFSSPEVAFNLVLSLYVHAHAYARAHAHT
jgi:hypothetical protein